MVLVVRVVVMLCVHPLLFSAKRAGYYAGLITSSWFAALFCTAFPLGKLSDKVGKPSKKKEKREGKRLYVNNRE